MGNYVPPTPKMVNYLRNLARDRAHEHLGATADERVAYIDQQLANRDLDKFQAMGWIDELKSAPIDVTDGVKPGVYRRNGEIFVAQLNRAKTNMYAKRLVEIGGRRLTEANEKVKVEFEYAPGAYQTLRPEDQMTLDEAKPYLIRYSNCMVCGRHLKDADSVERSIGPVCVKMFLPDKPARDEELDVEHEDRMADLLAKMGL